MRTWLFKSPSQDDLIHVLLAWRIWLLATLVGALLGSVVQSIFPPAFRAQATVTVDQNLEQAWPNAYTEREQMTYLSRETQKLVEVAWSDSTLQMVVDQNPGDTISGLREGVLQLSLTSDGAWHFWADDPDSQKAAHLAIDWAKAFYDRSLQGIEVATQIQSLQATLLQTPSDPETLTAPIKDLELKTLGISPYLQMTLSQSEELPVKRTSGPMGAILAGAVGGWVLALLVLLFIGPKNGNRGIQ